MTQVTREQNLEVYRSKIKVTNSQNSFSF